MAGTLHLVATPIGNLDDLSPRAVNTLRKADLIACEDTRHTGRLLKHFGIEGKLLSYHEHNEKERAEELVQKLLSGTSVAIVTDAGTPGIADPAYRVVKTAIEAGIRVESVPGPTAFVAAVVVSGLPTDSIFFGGFLPSRQTRRLKRFEELREVPGTLVFFESPRRIVGALEDCMRVLGDRRAAVSREITKLHEQTLHGTVSGLLRQLRETPAKGEVVLMIDRESVGARPGGDSLDRELIETINKLLEKEGLTERDAVNRAAKALGVPRDEAYRVFQRAPGSVR